MGMQDEMKKFEESKSSVVASFEKTEKGIGISLVVNANGQEVNGLILSLVEMVAEQEGKHVTEVLKDITLEMMMRDILGGNE